MGSLDLYAGGPAIRGQCQRYIQQSGDLAFGGVYVSTAGRLPCKHVIHVVEPSSFLHFFASLVIHPSGLINSLLAADQLGLSSISLAAHTVMSIGCLIDTWVPHFGCTEIITAVKDFLEDHPLTSVRKVSLVDPCYHAVDDLRRSLGAVFGSRMVTTYFGRDDTSQEEG